MIRITDQYFWNIIFLIFYSALLVMAVIVLDGEAYIAYTDLTSFDIAIISLASFRLMRFFMYDSMTKWIREQFYDAKITKAGKVTLYKPATGPRRTLCDLIGCSWCFGILASSVVVFLYLLTPLAYVPVLIFAIASIVALLQGASMLIYSKVE